MPVSPQAVDLMQTLNFFFLLVSPPQKVIKDVAFFKSLILEALGHRYRSLYSTAHLSLLQYYDPHNESLLYRFSEQLTRIKPFEISIDGFDKFEKNGTIYLKIVNDQTFSELSQLLLGHTVTPHITIARGLNSTDFQKAWKLLKNLPYKFRFTCDCVTVLKRLNNRWQPHTELPLTLACVLTGQLAKHYLNVRTIPKSIGARHSKFTNAIE
jgi:2'-5' RNA ligase